MKARMSVAVILTLLTVNALAERAGDHWIIRNGDTLYGIARAIHPKNPRKQAELRTQIIQLNQDIFLKGSGRLVVGERLKLPGLTVNSTTTSKPVRKPQRQSSPVVSSSSYRGTHWTVKYGETLYAISRKIFPRSGRQQERLRRDIIQLNPQIFSGGVSRMEIGTVLTLPEYLHPQEPKRAVEITTAAVTPPTETRQVTEPSAEQQRAATEENREETSQREMDKPRQVEVDDNDYGLSKSWWGMQFAFSLGGDEALINVGGRDVTYGSGFHLRLTYDKSWESHHGFRVGLGYQYDALSAGADSGELSQLYLQGMYIYDTYASAFGIGGAYHSDINFSSTISGTTLEYTVDPSFGVVLLYEYKRIKDKHILGIAHTVLESNHPISSAAIDMSRTELYYSIRFE